MGKCEWKDGKQIGSIEDVMVDSEMSNFFTKATGRKYTDKETCVNDIRRMLMLFWNLNHVKPISEGKPLIVKSGGTFVTEHEEINYLWTEQESPEDIGSIDYDGKWKVHCGWKPFSEIEKESLTDEIAKSRPMVCGGIQKYTLYGVLKEEGITWLLISDTLNDIEWYDNRLNDFRLATPHELQEK